MANTCCQVEQCCCMCSLKTGTKILTIMQLIALIGRLVFSGVNIYNAGLEESARKITCVHIIQILITVSWIVCTGFAIDAAWNDKRKHLIPYLIISVLGITLSLIAAVLLMVKGLFGVMSFELVCSALEIYFWVVIYSFYQERSEEDPQDTEV